MSDLTAQIETMTDTLVAWRRDFHRHPELAFEERRTSDVIRGFLKGRASRWRPAAAPACAAS